MSESTRDVSVALDFKPMHYSGLPLSGAVGSFKVSSALLLLLLLLCILNLW